MALIAQAPACISFGGGGTDRATYYRRYGGIVISAAINRYVYTIVSNRVDGSSRIGPLSDHPFFHRPLPPLGNPVGDGDLALPQTVLDYFGIKAGIHISLASELPLGVGLGSFGSLAVSMVAGLSAWLGRSIDKHEIAETACHIEIDRMGMSIGKQDVYAVAFGGLNIITFTADRTTVEPVQLTPDALARLQRSVMLFYIDPAPGLAHSPEHPPRVGEPDRPEVVQRLHAIKAQVLEVRDALTCGDVDALGELMRQSWPNRRGRAADADNSKLAGWHGVARQAGALGGTATNADGSGYLMLICPPDAQPDVTTALGARGVRRIDFAFDFMGARIISADAMPAFVKKRPQTGRREPRSGRTRQRDFRIGQRP